ncbi:hypothetical protein VB711_16950 [Cronbergia sp. UHCC 0137]|uniref:hypothetical protein n=1 Tax=Cronbergia sp. UHCC 0137 TaxID=3110239 RepID=UPI002B201C5E|nr:hypothetical protein [Cronbergia sp. UHCC 0137]MEA5619515.1 hypothetical protein [Cronbergia sp. UHCC 0137]
MSYRDINKAAQLKKDYDNLKEWQEKSTEQKQTAFEGVNTPANTVKINRIDGYIAPFGVTGTSLVYVPIQVISATNAGRGGGLATSIRTVLNDDYTYEALTGTPIIVAGAKNFKPAKVTVKVRVSTASTKSRSRITGRLYYKHEHDSVSSPFGKKIVGNDYVTVRNAIDVALKALNLPNQTFASFTTIKFTPEKY